MVGSHNIRPSLAKVKRVGKNVAKTSVRPNIVDSQAVWLRGGQDIAAGNGLLYSAVETAMETLHEKKRTVG